MSEISDKIQEKCLAFGDRVIKLNDYLLEEASKKAEVGGRKARVPVYLQSVATLSNQLLRAAPASERTTPKRPTPSVARTFARRVISH